MHRRQAQTRPQGTRQKRADSSPRSTAICVLGMHRSGTSLVIRLLNLMGAHLGPPERVMPPTEHNPKGYWEHQEIVHLNEAILNCLGGRWDEPPELERGWESSPELAALRRRARALIRNDFQGAPLWGWKDPRNSLTLPFWRKLVPNIRCVICLRNPLDVTSSLQRRDGFSTVKCMDLWLHYTAVSLENTSGLPRLFLSYEDLFQDWWGAVQRLARFIDIPLDGDRKIEDEIWSVIEDELWHHRSTVVDALDTPELAVPAKSLYFVLRSLVATKQDNTGNMEFQESLDILAKYAVAERRRLATLKADNTILGEQLREKEAQVAEKERALAEKDGLLTEKDGLLTEKDGLLAEKDATLAKAEARLVERESLVAQHQKALDQTMHELATIRQSLGYRLLEAYRRRVRWLFPPDSLRGLPYRALVRVLRGILDVRPWASPGRAIRAIRVTWARVHRLAKRSILVIRREGWRAFGRKARKRLGLTLKHRTIGPLPGFPPIDYQEWIAHNEPGAAELGAQRARARELPYLPLISIIVPVWNPPVDSLTQTIESVLAQTYDRWELCIADGGSTQPGVRELLERFASRDGRIHVKCLNDNLGISGNSNEALALARGEFVAFLDHTDLVAPFALWEVVQLLNRDPGLDCIYSDMDLLSEDGASRFNPMFKPEWSPDLMLSANYMAHFHVVRKALVDELGGLRSEMDGAQDWDLLLRLSERTERIARIPKILYHWRADATSAAISVDNKPYAVQAQERTVQEHLDRCGLAGQVVRDKHGDMRVKWQVTGETRVSIIIPTRHNRRLLKRCLRGIDRSTYRNWEILVVETARRNRAREAWYRRLQAEVPLRVMWWEKPFNFSAVNNFAAGQAQGDALLFLNDDTEALTPDWLEELVGWLEQPGIGVVGAQLLAEDGTIQHGGDIVGLEGFAAHLFNGASESEWTPLGWTKWYRNLLAVTGACLLVQKDVFDTAGGFDESFVLCGSDVELCFRIGRGGYRVVCTPYARVLHRERATRGSHDFVQDCFTSFWHYQPYLFKGDPFFSPNLSPASSVPQLRAPEEPTAVDTVALVLGRDITPHPQRASRMEDEAATLVEACQSSSREIAATGRLHQANGAYLPIKSINWFIPDFESPFYGGIHTILRFAAHFQRHYGVKNRFIVLGSGPEQYIRSGLKAAFPELGEAEIKISSLSEVELQTLPEADASIATFWVTAYAVSKFQRTKRKFYFVQDFEPMFYPAGTLYALAEATYRMGLYGIANSPPLKEIYESAYGGKAVVFTPCVDASIFHPPNGPRRGDEPLTVFLYGRPGHWRNCYELAMATLRRLKERLNKRVRIVTAGSWVSAADPASAYVVDHLGLLDYRETANLYRTCDVGLVLSVSKHPSYLPLELMACGTLVVSNINPAGSWLLRDGENSLLVEPTAESLCEAIELALLDRELRERLVTQALADISERHSDWAAEIDRVFRFLADPEAWGAPQPSAVADLQEEFEQ